MLLPLILALHSTPAITCPTREVVRVVNEQKALPGPRIQPVRKARVRIRPAVATPMACVRMPCPLHLALPGARFPQPDVPDVELLPFDGITWDYRAWLKDFLEGNWRA